MRNVFGQNNQILLLILPIREEGLPLLKSFFVLCIRWFPLPNMVMTIWQYDHMVHIVLATISHLPSVITWHATNIELPWDRDSLMMCYQTLYVGYKGPGTQQKLLIKFSHMKNGNIYRVRHSLRKIITLVCSVADKSVQMKEDRVLSCHVLMMESKNIYCHWFSY